MRNLKILRTGVYEWTLYTMSNQGVRMSSATPTCLLPLTQALEANWKHLLSHTEGQSWPRQQSRAHYPQQGSALLQPALRGRTWLTSQLTSVPVASATSSWQRQRGKNPTLQGIDWVSNAVRGGLGGVLLSPSVLGEAWGVWALPSAERILD